MPDLNASSDDIVMVASVEDMEESLPSHDPRTCLLATDVTFSHLFGTFCCQSCPECNYSSETCQDMFGSNATSEGCILGRIDAVYTSIEAQQSTGRLHTHFQVFVLCLHQHVFV